MNHIETMKQWLKALEEMNPYPASKEQLRADAMTSLRQAIEQADHMRDATKMIGRNPYGLTDKEITKLKEKNHETI